MDGACGVGLFFVYTAGRGGDHRALLRDVGTPALWAQRGIRDEASSPAGGPERVCEVAEGCWCNRE